MISFINIKNFAVVEETSLDLISGFNVLTGETGAGKSIIIDALSLFMKKKIQPHLFRDIDKKLIIEVMFNIEDEEIIMRREATKTKSISFLNGNMTPFIKVSELMTTLLNIYGQNEHIFLLNTKNHVLLLDKFCNNSKMLTDIEQVYDRLREKIKKSEELKKNKDMQNERIDYIKFQLNELEELKMEKGDDDNLRQESKILSSAEEIISNSNIIIEEFYQGENSLYSKIAQNLDSLKYLTMYPEMKPFNDEVNRFYNLLPELSETLTNLSGNIEYNETALNIIETKLLKLKQLEDKYKTDLKGLIDKKNTLKLELININDIDFHIKDIDKEIENIFLEYKQLNLKIRENRKFNAKKLSKIIEVELSKLEMKNAIFEVRFDEQEPNLENISQKGTDNIEFYFTSNLGQEVAKIKNVASGGELSRLMLVLKSIIDDKKNMTYIFDEIDTGIGGKTAEFVGNKLKSISKNNQVICISHLPQIAAFADKHFLIKKEFKDNNTFSYTEELSEESRIREIGRLMAGSNHDESILKAAKTLIENTRGNN